MSATLDAVASGALDALEAVPQGRDGIPPAQCDEPPTGGAITSDIMAPDTNDQANAKNQDTPLSGEATPLDVEASGKSCDVKALGKDV